VEGAFRQIQMMKYFKVMMRRKRKNKPHKKKKLRRYL